MSKTRLEAFTDAVVAIIMTILVLGLTTPFDGAFERLYDMRYEFLVYLVSFVTLAIYWNNHHHLFQITKRVSGGVLWCNIALLLFLSLIPFSTSWLNTNIYDLAPQLFYGCNMLCVDIVWLFMAKALIAENGKESSIAKALAGSRKSWLSIGVIVLGLLAGMLLPPLVMVACIVSLIPWIIPDKRIETMMHEINRAESSAKKKE